MSDDEETVEKIYDHCPELELCEVWLICQASGRPALLPDGDWQEGATKLQYGEGTVCGIEEFVLVYSTKQSPAGKCSICWTELDKYNARAKRAMSASQRRG
ncbi:hypothetical protein NLG97_g4563 [Lecanicillium saksenae]|uniref:Uncharacterized protein n=1 Tax=Lecanicillium saksenae TaxID=468837 RepID=A0ACC1QUY3_9HYPO|nr:hypothetical protein NLG97_g4563 [Lecanicillium saksenae]